MDLSTHIALTAKEVNLSEYNFIHPPAIAILALRRRKREVRILKNKDHKNAVLTFLSRINFYEYCGVVDPYGIRGDSNSTIEINEANLSSDKVFTCIRSLIKQKTNLKTIELMVTELMANAEMHSKGLSAVVGQVIAGKLHLCIADNGIGIRASLAENPKYANLTEPQAIKNSVIKGVTNGRGRGFGLWSSAEILIHNEGSLKISSGSTTYDVTQGSLSKSDKWMGTYVEIVYNLGNPVDYTAATGLGEDYEISDEDFGF